ncbi:MAG: hypothetical protein GY751_24355 [Bacteroidetes bacterium]|nr:hypothetical protein [Bacteroidota bacterium]
MRAQTQNPYIGHVPADKVSMTKSVKYIQRSKSCTGFPGGRVFAFFTNSTLERATVGFSESTWSR